MLKDSKTRVTSFSVGLRQDQLEWLENNKDFKIAKFFRDQLDKYIDFKKQVKQI